jgi:hypothetical protein
MAGRPFLGVAHHAVGRTLCSVEDLVDPVADDGEGLWCRRTAGGLPVGGDLGLGRCRFLAGTLGLGSISRRASSTVATAASSSRRAAAISSATEARYDCTASGSMPPFLTWGNDWERI